MRIVLILLLVLLCEVAITLAVDRALSKQESQLAAEEFGREVDNAISRLKGEIQSHITLLVALRGLFHSFDDVDRDIFRKFVHSLQVEGVFPNTRTVMWVKALSQDQIANHVESVRNDVSLHVGGYPYYSVYPRGFLGTSHVVTFVEPMEGLEGVFGYDLSTNAERLRSIELARDVDKALATAPVLLMPEAGMNWGFLVMMPVYRSLQIESLEERREQFEGVVVAEFNIRDLIEDATEQNFAAIRAYDVTTESSSVLPEPIFEREHEAEAERSGSRTLSRNVYFSGRKWVLEYTQSSIGPNQVSSLRQWAVLGFGAIASILSLVLVGYLLTSRQRALRIANELTAHLKTVNRDLARSNEDLSQFAHMASHDLQTPVRNIMSTISLLDECLEDHENPDAAEFLGFLRQSAARMKSLISDLLSYAEVGQSTVSTEPVDLNLTLSAVVAATSIACEEAEAHLEIGEMPTVMADEQQIERTFVNLIINAIKYSDPNVSPHIEISAKRVGGNWEIRTKDNGVGISPEYQELVFQPFQRLHSQSQIEGTGLGLAICKQVLHKHGGDICLESSSKSGSTMLMTLPCIQ